MSEEGLQGHTAESTSQWQCGPVSREWSLIRGDLANRYLYSIGYLKGIPSMSVCILVLLSFSVKVIATSKVLSVGTGNSGLREDLEIGDEVHAQGL